jgi:hypothetical protein
MKWILLTTIIVIAWTALIRPWLRKKPGAQWFFNLPLVEWIEIHVYKKSETIAWARYLTALGTVMTMIANIDQSSAQMMIQMFEPVLPERFKGVATFIPMIISMAGLIAEWQRRDTTKPLEVVALPSDAPVEVKAAVAEADSANRVAKAMVATFKEAA